MTESKSQAAMRVEEIGHVMRQARLHNVTVPLGNITFAENGHYPYIEGQDADNWILAVCGCGGTCEAGNDDSDQ